MPCCKATPLPPKLEGESVVLRRFTGTDLTDTYIGWLNDPAAVRYSNQRFITHSRASCARYLASFDCSPNLFVSVLRKEDERAIGTLTAYRSQQHGTVDIGILIGETSVWGQGHGQDAWNLLCDWLAAQPGIRKLTCGMLATNQAMVRLAERSGFELEAVRRGQEMLDGVPTDILYYARFTDGGVRT